MAKVTYNNRNAVFYQALKADVDNYFKEKGMDLRCKDNRDSTPLHWACYSKSEIALSYLLSW